MARAACVKCGTTYDDCRDMRRDNEQGNQPCCPDCNHPDSDPQRS